MASSQPQMDDRNGGLLERRRRGSQSRRTDHLPFIVSFLCAISMHSYFIIASPELHTHFFSFPSNNRVMMMRMTIWHMVSFPPICSSYEISIIFSITISLNRWQDRPETRSARQQMVSGWASFIHLFGCLLLCGHHKTHLAISSCFLVPPDKQIDRPPDQQTSHCWVSPSFRAIVPGSSSSGIKAESVKLHTTNWWIPRLYVYGLSLYYELCGCHYPLSTSHQLTYTMDRYLASRDVINLVA